jgi:hypothetical protein
MASCEELRTKFITQEIAKENALVRLTQLEESIANLSRLIQLAQGAQKAWNTRENAYKEQMAKKVEYHGILQAEVKDQLAINGVVVPKNEETFCENCQNDYYTEIDGLMTFTCTCRRI